MATLTPLITATGTYPYSWGEAETYSYVPILNDAGRPLFAKAGYITNFSDLTINLSANDVTIGSVQLTNATKTIQADVANIGNGVGALRVLTQDFDSVHDNVSIGDKSGNYATVNPVTSGLRVTTVDQLPSVIRTFNNFGINSNNGFYINNNKIPVFAIRIKPGSGASGYIDGYSVLTNTVNGNATFAMGYTWYYQPTAINGAGVTWNTLSGSNLQYTILADQGSGGGGTPNTFSGGAAVHSGLVSQSNAATEYDIADFTLVDNLSSVLLFTAQRLDASTVSSFWFAVDVAQN